MKTRFVLLAAALMVGAWAAQDGLKFGRTYKVGESDAYSMAIAIESDMGPFDISMKMSQTVKKVYENGDADLETAVTDMTVNAMGNTMNPPAPPATLQRVNNRGVPIGGSTGAPGGGMRGGMGMMLNFGRFGGVMTDKEMKVGVPVAIDDPQGKTKGTVTLQSVADGVAVLVTKLEITQGEASQPMKVDAKIWLDTATSKLNKMEGVVSGSLPGQQQVPVQQVKVRMERVVDR
ncbi:MAG: hypothetical protein M9921_15365 [Fimbriimonadaceae bacterium]|nr:hypothetical protein [Fimbriimonadaceae bacterium]